MTGLIMLIVASVAFVGTHFLMSHPLRAGMVGALGEKGFAGVYTLVSFLTLGWMIWAYPAGSVLFMGSLRRNPALPRPGRPIQRIDDPNGVYAITRHPMMWGFALWALVHAVVIPTEASLILSFAIA